MNKLDGMLCNELFTPRLIRRADLGADIQNEVVCRLICLNEIGIYMTRRYNNNWQGL